MKLIWKMEDELQEDNILTGTWFPQQVFFFVWDRIPILLSKRSCSEPQSYLRQNWISVIQLLNIIVDFNVHNFGRIQDQVLCLL